MSDNNTLPNGEATDVDAIVIGAGFGGIRALIELKRRGFSARLLEAGTATGGTWYWNRYPGARTDSLSWTYCYLFDKDLVAEWNWTHNYPLRTTVQAYLEHVIDRYELRPDIQFSTAAKSAVFDGESNRWTVQTSTGETFTSTYFITCVGHLSEPLVPEFVDADAFEGEIYYTSRWPKTDVDMTGKRVAVVGTGASGVQAAPYFAKQADHVTLFQRTPNYVLPARYRDLTEEDQQRLRVGFEEMYARTRVQPWGFDMLPAGRMYDDVSSEEERDAVFEEAYQNGGFHFVFEAFDDLVTDKRSNEAAADFLRRKIRSIVTEPATAELLCPKYPLVAKRPPVGEEYFEMFNKPNVSLVDVSSDPLATMTQRGLQTASGTEYEADVIVIATGFDVSTGPLTKMDIRGLDGQSLGQQWESGIDTFLGVGVPGFPNMFMVAGPQAGAGNQPVIMERIVEFIGEIITYAKEHEQQRVEVSKESAEDWTALLAAVLNATVVAEAMEQTNSWLIGANSNRKVHQSMLYLGGFGDYSARMDAIAESGFEEFSLSGSK